MASSSIAALQVRPDATAFPRPGTDSSSPIERKKLAQQFCLEQHNGTQELLALSGSNCVVCDGRGVKGIPSDPERRTCRCVWRKVFRVCLERYRCCHDMDGLRMSVIAVVDSPLSPGPSRRVSYGFRHSEYIADFELIARRALDADELRIFKLHYVAGKTWRECCTRLRLEKGDFFHTSYRIEEKLGHAFVETRPHPLYPSRDYFGDA